MSFKLSKTQRLRNPRDYRRVYRSKHWGGSPHHTYNILIDDKMLSSDTNAPTALGITVSKKVSKLAVERNLIKRQIKEFYRLHQQQLVLSTQLIITAKPSCASANHEQRQQSLKTLWHKIIKWQRWYLKTQKKDC